MAKFNFASLKKDKKSSVGPSENVENEYVKHGKKAKKKGFFSKKK